MSRMQLDIDAKQWLFAMEPHGLDPARKLPGFSI